MLEPRRAPVRPHVISPTTDDYNEQDFKSPEEIRKANLRGADLRGAHIDGVDFYLVDLRDALDDAAQEQQFQICGAILESRVS